MSDVEKDELERRMQWLLEEHDRMKEVIAELQQNDKGLCEDCVSELLEENDSLKKQVNELQAPDFRYMPLAIVVAILSYLYGITLGVYVCPK